MQNKPLVYLACPYSHEDFDVRLARFEAVNRIASRLMQAGHIVFSPISHTHPIALAGRLPIGWEYWQYFDAAYLQHSYKLVVLCLEGWDTSEGVRAEIAMARQLGIAIEYINPL